MANSIDLGKITASVTVGTVTTGDAGSSASVTNSGTTQDAVLNFTIPRGAKGDTGNTGPAGPQGPMGPSGYSGAAEDLEVVQVSGDSATAVMSQKAVTDALDATNQELAEFTDITSSLLTGGAINVSTNKYHYGAGETGYFIPVRSGYVYNVTRTSEGTKIDYAFLSSISKHRTNNGNVDYVSGYSTVSSVDGNTATITPVSGCNYIYLYGTNKTYTVLEGHTVKKIVSELKTNLDTLPYGSLVSPTLANLVWNVSGNNMHYHKSYVSPVSRIYVGTGNKVYLSADFTGINYIIIAFYADNNESSKATTSTSQTTGKHSVITAEDEYMRVIFYSGNESVALLPENVDFKYMSVKINTKDLIGQQDFLDPTDFGAVYDGKKDCSAAIQSCLNLGGTIRLRGSGTALCKSSLLINQNHTHIIMDEGFTLKLDNGVNAQLIKTPGSAYNYTSENVWSDTLYDISIEGGTLDFNGLNQSRVTTWYITNSGISITDTIGFRMENVTLKNPIAFTFHAGNLHNFTIRNIVIDNYDRLINEGSFNNTDGLHFNGDAWDGLIENIHGVAGDDFIGLNCGADQGKPSSTPLRIGSCKNVVIRNIFIDQKESGVSSSLGYVSRVVRLLGSENNDFDNILIDGIYGEQWYLAPILISGYGAEGAKFGRVIIRNVGAYSKYSNAQSPIVNVGHELDIAANQTTVESLIIDGVQIHNASSHINGLVALSTNSIVKHLSISNISLSTDDVANTRNLIYVNGSNSSIGTLMMDKVNIVAPTSATKIPKLLAGNITTAFLSNINADVTSIGDTPTNLYKNNVVINGTPA